MKKLVIALAAAGMCVGTSMALAGPGGTNCAGAEQLAPGGSYAGDTSAPGYGNNTNSFGMLPSPANDSYYYFVSDGQPSGTINVTASYNSGVALVGSCGNDAVPMYQANGAPAGTPYSVIVDNGAGGPLVAGTTYWVIVTGIPTGTAADNGPYNFTTPDPLPVTLQEFSID